LELLMAALVRISIALAALLSLWTGPAQAANGISGTLERVRANKDLRCAVFPDDPSRSAIDASGNWAGFYVEFCRAVAAAVLGNPDYVEYVEVGSTTRFTALAENKADVVMYSSTWTFGREADYRILFPTIYLFDGQGIMVRAGSGITSLDGLKDKTICVTATTSTEDNLRAILLHRKIDAKVIEANGDSFFRGGCDAYTADRMNLAINRANRADDPAQYVILPDILSREPIGPMVRDDDLKWARIIRSVVNALVLAEEKGITRANVDAAGNGDGGGEIDNLLGRTGKIGPDLGLDPRWAVRVIEAVGNYGEIYDRYLGPKTPAGVDRGLNRLWSDGGLLYAPPFL
jgi:general L-amino acid transport system substrate-binding protein